MNLCTKLQTKECFYYLPLPVPLPPKTTLSIHLTRHVKSRWAECIPYKQIWWFKNNKKNKTNQEITQNEIHSRDIFWKYFILNNLDCYRKWSEGYECLEYEGFYIENIVELFRAHGIAHLFQAFLRESFFHYKQVYINIASWIVYRMYLKSLKKTSKH